MPIDANGIYQYEETDLVSPFSDFMNLGQSSVSTEVASLQSQIDALENQLLVQVDTGWVTLPYTSGTSSAPTGEVKYRAKGNLFTLSVDITLTADIAVGTTGNVADVFFTSIPAEYRTGQSITVPCSWNTSRCVWFTIYPGGSVALSHADALNVAYNITSGGVITGIYTYDYTIW